MCNTSQQQNPYEDPEYKCYREDLAQAQSTRLEVFKIFASHSLAISSGLVAASGYLLKEFHDLSHLWLLLISAAFATASLIAALFELIFSQSAALHLEAKLHKAYQEQDHTKETKQISHYAYWCEKLLYAIPWLILIAVFITGLFLWLNIPHFQKGDTVTIKPSDINIQEVQKFVVRDMPVPPRSSTERPDANVPTDTAVKPKQPPATPQNEKQESKKP